MILQFIKKIKKSSDSIIHNIDRKTKLHRLKCAFEIERELLSNLESMAKEYINNASADLENIVDIADGAYKNISILNSFDQPSRAETKDLLEYKKDIFVWPLMPLTVQSNVVNKSKEEDMLYQKLLRKRQYQITALRDECIRTTGFSKVFCVFLARSNYPKKDAFNILSEEFESVFDLERKKSKHLKGVEVLNSLA